MDDNIHHVSDTALMVAAARALESARPGGLIHDPFAAKLAGDRGMAMVTAHGREWMRMAMSVRTYFIDQLIEEAIAERGVTTVLNLGAGLDARPWRLDLPARLRWIEVDFAPILGYKLAALAGAIPRCVHEALYADVTAAEDRERICAAVNGDPALMITEGLLMYLPADAVRAIATDVPTRTGVRLWLFDTTSPLLMQMGHGQRLDQIEHVRAKDRLDGVDLIAAVRQAGWRLIHHLSYVRDSAPLMSRLFGPDGPPMRPDAAPPPADDPSGVYLFAATD